MPMCRVFLLLIFQHAGVSTVLDVWKNFHRQSAQIDFEVVLPQKRVNTSGFDIGTVQDKRCQFVKFSRLSAEQSDEVIG